MQFIPPASSDPELLHDSSTSALGTLGIGNDDMGSTAKYMLKNTLPLGFHVTDKVKQAIWADNYVDFYILLPNFNVDEEDTLLKNDLLKISKNTKPKVLFSIHQWTSAFDIYMSIYFEKHQDSILALIKYGSNIRDMSKNFGFSMAKSYDEVFRRVHNPIENISGIPPGSQWN
jgi:hypothetical protein